MAKRNLLSEEITFSIILKSSERLYCKLEVSNILSNFCQENQVKDTN